MSFSEWQCPKKDHSEIPELAEASSVVLLDPPPSEGWKCWRCQTPLEWVRDYPVRQTRPELPIAPEPELDIKALPGPAEMPDAARLFG